MNNRWVNEKFLRKDATLKLSKEYRNSAPFPNLAIRNFFSKGMISEVRQAVKKQKFERKDTDLFSFYQSQALEHTKDRAIRNFFDFIASRDFMQYIAELTGENLASADMHAHIFRQGDYLLFHDDDLEKRRIAYIIYLSIGFKEKDGGRLQLFDIANPRYAVKNILPEFNSFAFFKVSKKSLHAVEEVMSDKERLTVGGWFYGP